MTRADNQQERLKINNIQPWYITGFTEGEGTFHVAISYDSKTRFGIKIIPEFHINQSYLRKVLLEKIKDYFDCGYIRANHAQNKKDTTFVYVVRNRNDLKNKIIPFFQKYPLKSKKNNAFMIFTKIVNLMSNGKHYNYQGIKLMIKLAFTMNEGGKYRKLNQEDVIKSLNSSETIR